MAPLCRCPRPPSPSPKNTVIHPSESSISECVRLCDTHSLYLWYETTFRVTFLSVTHHVCTYVLCENRSSIQSLVLGNYIIPLEGELCSVHISYWFLGSTLIGFRGHFHFLPVNFISCKSYYLISGFVSLCQIMNTCYKIGITILSQLWELYT